MRTRALLVAFGALLVLAACGTAPSTPASTSGAPLAKASAGFQITDSLGRSVTLDAAPQRIVSLAPSVTETLFAIGAGAQVVGDTSYCNYPPAADVLPEVGGFGASSISVEAIASLEPDLVIAGTASQALVVEKLDELRIPAVVLAPEDFDDVYAAIAQVGAITGHSSEAERVVGDMRARVAAVTEKLATIPAGRRPSVFWELSDDPLITSGPNTFIGQLIGLAGAANLFADAGEDYPQISVEAVIARDPDVIAGPSSQAEKLTPTALSERPGWSTIAAVRSGRVFSLDGDIVSRPGPRLADALEALARALYPEVFT